MALITQKEACSLIQIADGEAWTTSLVIADEEFNARVDANLINELKQREKALLELQPNTTLLTGYHAGFEAGFAKARESVLAALEAA